MSTHCYIGAADPDNPHVVHARFVLFDGHPSVVLPTLAAIWAGHARRDARALITAILACDWEHLDPDITSTAACGFAGQRPVPGVGMTLACTTTDGVVDAPEPVSVFPLCHAGHLDAEWIYLIEAGTAAVAVHTDDGTRIGAYPLTGCLHPTAADRRPPPPCEPRPSAGAQR
ncbi:hypothetical protein U2F26_31930 [Micromonospora sp. 4G57]|uniref:Uncharacterized protein n=1 Tax=Micromonospora sicca TaxID=2202420 RepID=A0ABU5JMV9_9ACTN|nr:MULTISPECIES: hypothetical protein [unclassified Micromonospora]MDZ5447266.1 hypothetical protein [Micromonospora sp. 4G57]MDZ5493962.1 hypothetical protein [Micromonospora sp. 4G53]